ncbi:Protein of unknown function DUF3468 [Penicillium angulare]|uniref:Protein of unknown function DUF3468 n=1 Tax=Penicillium angulare TaxID=116970 RepID=UPI0025414D67|nr:Protein of unknown function DUF3468 [Penicillium angulare]KAJ5272471.1 Protein of unknown function DUF3468 [Penicillium angulare]
MAAFHKAHLHPELRNGPRPGEYLVFSGAGQAEWLVLMRSVRSILMSSHKRIFSDVLESQDVPAIQGVGTWLEPELREPQSCIDEVECLLQPQVAESASHEIYIEALRDLRGIFEELHQMRSAGKYGISLIPFFVCWIYRRPDEFIGLLERKEPCSSIILAYCRLILKFMESSWLMLGWDRHVITGIQESLGSQ